MENRRESVDLVEGDTVRSFARATLLAALMGATAHAAIPIPISMVEITLQVLVTFLAGLYLGPLWGGISLALYLTAGALGAPVFAAATAGTGVLLGPSGGYLFGFFLAAILIGAIVHRRLSPRDPAAASTPVLVGALVVGLVVIYALGAAWLGWVQQIGPIEAITLGVVPFVPFDLLKLAAAVAIVKRGHLDPT